MVYGDRCRHDGCSRDGFSRWVNKEIVSLINCAGGSAVGLCGMDGNLIVAQKVESNRLCGEVTSMDVKILESLVSNGYIPVVSSVAADETGQAS